MEKYEILYSLNDNKEQFQMLKLSLLSLFEHNKNISVTILVDSFETKKKVKNFCSKHLPQKDIQIIEISNLTVNKQVLEKDARFYWYFYPYLIKKDFFILLDNDTIINGNINEKVEKEIISSINTGMVLTGAKDFWWGSSYRKEYIEKYLLNEETRELFENRYINNAVVLVNVNNWKKILPESSVLERELCKYIDEWEGNFIPQGIAFIPEQEFSSKMFLLKGKTSTSLDPSLHWNMYRPYDYILKEKESPLITHYFAWLGHNKFNFEKYINNNSDIEKFEIEINNLVLESRNHKIKEHSDDFNEKALFLIKNNTFVPLMLAISKYSEIL